MKLLPAAPETIFLLRSRRTRVHVTVRKLRSRARQLQRASEAQERECALYVEWQWDNGAASEQKLVQKEEECDFIYSPVAVETWRLG